MVRRGGFYLKIPIFPKSRAGKIPSKMPLSPNEGAERLTIRSQLEVNHKMNSCGEREMVQKGYSKAEVLSDLCWLFK